MGKHFAYVEQFSRPILKKGDIVLDNLRTHKVDGVHQAIEAVGSPNLTAPLLLGRRAKYARFCWCCSRD
jgi:hypothetical protein